MTSVLKGNFTPRRKAPAGTKDGDDLESQFEKKALKRLGGSVAFVAKKRVNWDLKEDG